jgi:hypothetical protein
MRAQVARDMRHGRIATVLGLLIMSGTIAIAIVRYKHPSFSEPAVRAERIGRSVGGEWNMTVWEQARFYGNSEIRARRVSGICLVDLSFVLRSIFLWVGIRES